MPERFVDKAPITAKRIEKNLQALQGRPISLDIDAVTQATFYGALITLSRKLELVNPIRKHQMITYWELKKISERHLIPPDESLEFSKSAWNNVPVYKESPRMPGITSLLKILHDIDYPHLFISSRPTDFLATTHEWFGKYFKWIDSEAIIIARPDHMSGEVFKTSEVLSRGVGLHIEDSPEEALAIAAGTTAKVLVVPQPWNTTHLFDHARTKYLGPYNESAGSWPVLKFLASNEAYDFLLQN